VLKKVIKDPTGLTRQAHAPHRKEMVKDQYKTYSCKFIVTWDIYPQRPKQIKLFTVLSPNSTTILKALVASAVRVPGIITKNKD